MDALIANAPARLKCINRIENGLAGQKTNLKSLLAMVVFGFILQVVINTAFAVPRTGIDCGCASTGVWQAPSTGRDLDVILDESSPASGTSPNGKYLIEVPTDFTKVSITIRRASDNVIVFNNQFALGSGWGFSPDDDRFVVHIGGGDYHSVQLYNLDTDSTNDLIAVIDPSLVDNAYVSFSRHGKYLLYTSRKDASLVIDVIDVATGNTNINHITGITLAAPPPPDEDITIAGWGFSPDSQDATFVYAWNHSGGAAVKVRNLASGVDVFEDVNLALPYSPQTDKAWFFSPCGDLYAIAYEEPNLFRAYATFDGAHVDDGAVFNSSDHGFFEVRAELNLIEHLVYYQGGQQQYLPLADNTAPLACPIVEVDSDNDGWLDADDNCPLVYNPGQEDGNNNGIGNACENDQDGDSVADDTDNCPLVYNPQQTDSDQDGTGDACDSEGDDTPPSWPLPSTLNASSVTETTLQLSWTEAIDGAYQYNLYQDGSAIGQTLASGPRLFDVTALEPWTSYIFKVEAEDAAGNETANGPQAWVQTTDLSSPYWTVPAYLDVTLKTANSMTLEWTPAQDNVAVTQYRLYKIDGDAQELVAQINDVGNPRHSFTCLRPSTAFTFQVQAGDGAGNWSEGSLPPGGPTAQAVTLSGPACEGVTERASVSASGEQLSWANPEDGYSRGAAISNDGRYIAFGSDAENIRVADWAESPEIHIYDRNNGWTRPLATFSDPNAPGQLVAPYADNGQIDISGDGNWVAYSSRATFLVGGDTSGLDDIFVTRRSDGFTERVSILDNGDEATYPSYDPALSADGRYVVFQSLDRFGDDMDSNGLTDVFVHDRDLNTTRRVGLSSTGQQALDAAVLFPDISGDGRYVVFESSDSNLVEDDNNICQGYGQTGGLFSFPCSDVFIHDLQNSTTTRVSVSASGAQVTGVSTTAAINGNGRFVAFQSGATEFVASDTNDAVDIFVKDMLTGSVDRVSVASDGTEANDGSWNPQISADGRFVTFESHATNLDPADTNDSIDVYVRDRISGTTRLVSVCACGICGDDTSSRPVINGDGRVIAYESQSTNLLVSLGDTNGAADVFLHEWEPTQGDADAIPDSGEYGPAGDNIAYDGNFDGVADASESHVVSVHNHDASYYFTFAGPDGMVFEVFTPIATPSLDTAPAGVAFPWGLFEFTLYGLGSGESIDVTVYVPAGIAPTNFYMYASTAEEGSAHWYEFDYDGTTGAEINGNIITLHFVNGARGDDDISGGNDSLRIRGGAALSTVAEADISVSPTEIDFGEVLTGTSQGPRIVTISNIGATDLELSSINISGSDALRFSLLTDVGDTPCGATPKLLATVSNCNVGVVFTPVAGGAQTAQLDILSSDSDEGLLSIPLSGTTVLVQTQGIMVNPITHNFGTLLTGEPSSPFEFTISNEGDSALQIASIALSNQTVFALVPASTNNCNTAPFFLNAGQSCRIAATFTPLHEGDTIGGITITSNDADTPVFPVTLRGSGSQVLVITGISVTPGAHDFGTVQSGVTSSPVEITIGNAGDSALQISSIALSNDAVFALAPAADSNCGAAPFLLDAKQSCRIAATFSPLGYGNSIGVITITSDDPVTPSFPVTLRGSGSQVTLTTGIAVTPLTHNFGYVLSGQTSAPVVVTIYNVGGGDLEVSALEGNNVFNSAYLLVPDIGIDACGVAPFSILQGQSCDIQVLFSPTSTGSTIAGLTIASSDALQPSLALTFRGEASAVLEVPVLDLQPDLVDFGDVLQGRTSPPQQVTVTNRGDAAVTMQATFDPPLSGNGYDLFDISLAQENSCLLVGAETILQPGASCNYALVYRPQDLAMSEGTFRVTGRNGETSNAIELRGRMRLDNVSVARHLAVSPGSMDFGELYYGFASYLMSELGIFVLQNTGGEDLQVQHIGVSDVDNFTISAAAWPGACVEAPFSLAAGEICELVVIYEPHSVGQHNALIAINSDDPEQALSLISLTGTASAAQQDQNILLSHYAYNFGHTLTNISTPAAIPSFTIEIYNYGLLELDISAIDLSNDVDFGIAPCIPPPLAVSAALSCGIDVYFNPQQAGPVSGSISIQSNDPDTPLAIVSLSGFGATDTDGLSDTEESGPNGSDPAFDGNGDGVPDNQQVHVASLHSFDGSAYVTLYSSSPSIALGNVRAVDNPSPQDSPGGVSFPLGFYDFTLCCVNPGDSFTLSIKATDGAQLPDTYYKFGPTPENPVPHWYEFLYDGKTGAEFDGSVIVLHFVDGERGDDDLTANGSVTDIGAPGHKKQQGSAAGGSCFIATAAYGSYLDPQVQVLRDFRDHYLLTNVAGRALVAFYYANSPVLANYIAASEFRRAMTRMVLTPLVYGVKYPLAALVLLIVLVVAGARLRRAKKSDGGIKV